MNIILPVAAFQNVILTLKLLKILQKLLNVAFLVYSALIYLVLGILLQEDLIAKMVFKEYQYRECLRKENSMV